LLKGSTRPSVSGAPSAEEPQPPEGVAAAADEDAPAEADVPEEVSADAGGAAEEGVDETTAVDEPAADESRPVDDEAAEEGAAEEPKAAPRVSTADPSSTVQPLAAAIPPPRAEAASDAPGAPDDAADRQNLADTQVDVPPGTEASKVEIQEPTSAGGEEAVGADGLPLSAQPTQPPAPRQELPPGLSDMQTPLRPDRQPPPEEKPEVLPSDFKETPMGADWYVGTGQPLPERTAAPSESATTSTAGIPMPAIVGGVVVVAVLLCGGLLALVF
jgi:hypothetical protein